jgi:iron complex outermembrane receptor protein
VLAVLLPCAANSQAVLELPPINVIAPSPLAGTGIDRDKVPAMVQTVGREDFQRNYSYSTVDTLFERVPGVSINDVQGNNFLADLRYRGFAASPLPGTPQGIAVYMNGIRTNEAFGDTVNWDLIPSNAIDRADLWTNNPVFGLNALGGAVNIQMKNGFTYQGTELEVQGGSYGRLAAAFQVGRQWDNVSFYVAGQAARDEGWRYQSPSEIARIYADLGWKGDRTELHVIAAAARSKLGVIGPTPIELIDRDYRSIFTWPQTTRNEMSLFSLNGKHDITDTWSIQGNTYVRLFQQKHVDGNDADVERCSGQAANPLFNTLCVEDDGFPNQPKVNFQILDQNNKPIPCPPGAGNTCSRVPWGTVDRTLTETTTVGASLQAVNTAKLFDHDNRFLVGASVDHSHTNFQSSSELGFIFPNFFVGPNPTIPGNGSIIHTFGSVGYVPIDLRAESTYYGLFATDTFDITPRLSATAGARLNVANQKLEDQLGNAPDLNGTHDYHRLNPVVGLTYKLAPPVTVYGGYSESNRIPTPLELGCSNPIRPCLIESALVSDPPLKQVVSHSYEAGVRGNFPILAGRMEWKAGVFRVDSDDDIIFLASTIAGRGYFTNVEATRRQGFEAGLQYKSPSLLVWASYSYIDATYQFAGDIASPNNPSADADGNIHVTPGKHIPGIPQHQFKAGADYQVTPKWKVGGTFVAVGSQFFIGDDANQNAKLPSYWYLNLQTSYQLNEKVQVFALVNNVFDKKFATYGTYFDPEGLNLVIANPPTDHRTITPVQPLAVYVGMRVKL